MSLKFNNPIDINFSNIAFGPVALAHGSLTDVFDDFIYLFFYWEEWYIPENQALFYTHGLVTIILGKILVGIFDRPTSGGRT